MRILGRLTRSITPIGRGVLLLALACALLSGWFLLPVLLAVGIVLGVALGCAVVLVALPSRVVASLRIRPPHASVGGPVSVQIGLRNHGPAPLFQPVIRMPYPGGVHQTSTRWLPARRSTETGIEVVTTRRGVHQVGPVEVLREDPFGLLRWTQIAEEAADLYVRPLRIPVESLGLGQLSDVDGVASDQVSMSDLAFHALREYVPGDDLRHVHWRSSAKADRLLVRQYHDTRRSRVTVLIDAAEPAYASSADFELAVSVAASIGVRAVDDDLEVTLWGAQEELSKAGADALLDACCRIERGDFPLDSMLGRLLLSIPSPGLLVVITGHTRDPESLYRDLAGVRPEVRLLVLRCASGEPPQLRARANSSMGSVGELRHLPALMDQFLKGLG